MQAGGAESMSESAEARTLAAPGWPCFPSDRRFFTSNWINKASPLTLIMGGKRGDEMISERS